MSDQSTSSVVPDEVGRRTTGAQNECSSVVPVVPDDSQCARPRPYRGRALTDEVAGQSVVPPPEDPAVRDRWRAGLDEFLAKRERTRRLREQLALARADGKARRHADRLARAARNATTPRSTR